MSTPKIKVFSNGYSKTEADTKFATKADSIYVEKRVSNLEQQLSPSFIETDNSIAFEKVVPVDSCNYAQINKVGGMSYKSPVEAIDTITVTFDGEYTNVMVKDDLYDVNSLSTNNIVFVSNKPLPQGTIVGFTYEEYYIDDTVDSNGEREFDMDDSMQFGTAPIYKTDNTSEIHAITLTFPEGATFDNETFTFTIAPEGYFVGLRDTKVTELKSVGANLIPRASHDKQTTNGVTFTVQDDNSIVVNGTATETTAFCLQYVNKGEYFRIDSGETYTLSGCPEGGSNETYRLIVQDINYTQNFIDTGSGYTGVALKTDYYAFIRISKGYTANNLVFKPMFNRGPVAKPYSPFGTVVNTFPISAELRIFLEQYGYGQGNPDNPDEYNYIDFERKVFDAVGHVVDNAWVAYDIPIEIDISAYLTDDNFIEVEGGGSIVAVNEHSQAAPTSITYMLQEVDSE